ncbi:ABC transporter ATP-binding protein [Pseudonocardia sulfidoxydans NBRC 16205]|uniref:ABC transporter ATP-binding protein n=1 Tax=Pseudonocardia sulfidoxydans NBRC 16205 TaxID=1223511 RepID=A0A511DDU9_9PSEU|nr:ABC transporter ATP-binding protein [Pseudonocardia sulfidoxydans]GEL22707.1 ABC transporter ATP-binding protein [Pseudonocardia sulfidoxydans NBRC 16205]
MTAVLRFDAVRAYYDDALIVDGLSFEVEEGGCLALVGANGVGKTTSLNAMFGIAQLKSGTIEIDGKALRHKQAHEAARLGAALVPQGRWIISSLTIEENLILGRASGRTGEWTLEKVYELFPMLHERRTSPGDALSGGQQQMLAIGRALMANPRILLLDEPSEGLAPVVIDQLGDMLAALRAQGTSMLLIEQRLDLVHRLADHYAVMAKGAVTSQGRLADTTPTDLRSLVAI